MLNVALVGLLAGSLSIGTPGTGGDDKKTPNADKPAPEAVAPEAGPSVFGTPATPAEADAQDPRSITQDTYALGIPSEAAPIKLWVEYGYGQTSAEYWDASGDDATFGSGEITSQRIGVGAQINFISFSAFKLGVGGDLTVAKNAAQNASFSPQQGVTVNNVDSDFGLQGLKLYGTARGRVVGVHGGYILDFGDDTAQSAPVIGEGGAMITNSLGESDDRNALTFGADFDYPSDRIRLFGGVDYYHLARENNLEDGEVEGAQSDDDIWNFLVGAGLKFSVVEVGAALQIQTRVDAPTNDLFGMPGIGGHAGTVAPYLRISPPNLPASLFIKGAVQDEYTEYGYAIGGANSPKPKIGFTAGLSIGFE